MSRILRLYVIRAILTPTVMSLLTITFVLMVQITKKYMEFFMQPGVRLSQVLMILAFFLPSIVVFAAPMAVLVGTMIGVGRLVMDREVLAMRASGINLLNVFIPTIVCGILVSGSIFWLSREAIPHSLDKGSHAINELTYAWVNTLKPGQKYSADKLKVGDDLGNFLLYFQKRDEERHEMHGIVIKINPEDANVLDDKAKTSRKKAEKEQANAEGKTSEDAANPDNGKQKQKGNEEKIAKYLDRFYEPTTATLKTAAGDAPTTPELNVKALVADLNARGWLPSGVDPVLIETDEETLEDLANPNRDHDLMTIFGQRARLSSDLVRDEKGRVRLVYRLSIHNGSLHMKSADPRNPQYMMFRFEQTSFTQVRDGNFPPQQKMLTNGELRRQIKDNTKPDKSGKVVVKDDGRKARAELVERSTMPWAFCIFVLMGVPMAIRVRMAGKSWAILLAIGMMLVYFFIMQMGLAMVESQPIPGTVVALLPNLLFIALGGFLWWQTLRS